MEKLRIIFMGTPEFAVPGLEILMQNKYEVVAVITAPDKPRGRGQKLEPSPIKECAAKHSIPVLQPTNLKSPEFLSELKSYNANLQVVVAFRMLPEVVWAMPELGTFNLHASLLPRYRGAAPINWAIINGEKETGVTTFFLKHEIDTGKIILQEKETISDEDDAGSLSERLSTRGAKLILKTVRLIGQGNPPSSVQTEAANLPAAPKIFKETCQINWNQSAKQVRDFVRGLSPYPAAWALINGKTYKILKANVLGGYVSTDTEFKTDNKTFLHFRTLDGGVTIEELQPEGKRRMTIRDFFMGNRL